MKFYSPLTTNYSLCAVLALSACTPTATLNNLTETASGRITEVKNNINQAVQPIVDTIENVNEGIKKVQSGANLLKEGMDQIKGGVKE